MSYEAVYGLAWTALRYGNVYGPRQDPFGEAGVVAIFCQAMLKDAELNIFGTGEQLRDYLYVGDIVRANLLALERGDNKALNIGTGKGTSVNELFKELCRILNYQRPAVMKPPRAGEIEKTYLASSLASELLGWQAEVDLEAGLRLTAEYFAGNS